MSHGRRIAVVGLGYVGFPAAVAFAKSGTPVIGFDRDASRIRELREGRDRTRQFQPSDLILPDLTLTDQAQDISAADFFVISVPGSIDAAGTPDLSPILNASEEVGRALKPGDIVAYESTMHPGATEEQCIPVLQRTSGLTAGRDFGVGYSPERINPGDPAHGFTSITKVVAAPDADTLDILAAVFGSVVTAGIFRAASIRVAETAKCFENIQRDVNIALVNELSAIAHALNVDTVDVLAAAASKWNFLPFTPGLVGGRCMTSDAYYLMHAARRAGAPAELISSARRINDAVQDRVVHECWLMMQGLGSPSCRITVLGLTFKENVPDIRNSRVNGIVRELRTLGAVVQVHDPLADAVEAQRTGVELVAMDQLERADAIVLAVPHEAYLAQGWPLMLRLLKSDSGLVMDIRGRLDRSAMPPRGEVVEPLSDSADIGPRLRGSIDIPDGRIPVARAPMLVQGWALGVASPVSRIEISLDGRLQGRAGLGRVRADVVESPATADAELSGFEFRVDLSQLDWLGENAVLSARAILLDGDQVELPPVRIALLPRVTSGTLLMPALGGPVRPVPSRPRQLPAQMRLLCFARSLDRGGSQLRLKEIVQYLQASGEFVCTMVSPADGPLRQELEAAGVAIHISPIAIGDLAAYEQQVREMTTWAAGRFDIVLAGTLTSFAAVDIAGRLGLPSVWRIGENETIQTVADWLGEQLDPAVALKADEAFDTASVVMFISQSTLRMNWRSSSPGRFALLGHGIDVTEAHAYMRSTDRAACREAFGIGQNRRVLLCAGTLWPIKGQAALVAAMQQVRIDHPQLECIIVGQHTKPYAGALSRLIERHELAPYVRLLPFFEDLRPWWRAADVAVCPSESETMPASVLEAMAFGLPALATRVGGIPEVLDDDETGFLCEPNDLGSLVGGLVRIATAEPGTLQAMGERAAKRIERDYDRADAFQRLAGLLRHVARGSRPQWFMESPGAP